MGAYDGAEVCEFIGVPMLSLLSKHINKNHIGLYRDNTLLFQGTIAGQKQKDSRKIFKNYLEKKI